MLKDIGTLLKIYHLYVNIYIFKIWAYPIITYVKVFVNIFCQIRTTFLVESLKMKKAHSYSEPDTVEQRRLCAFARISVHAENVISLRSHSIN